MKWQEVERMVDRREADTGDMTYLTNNKCKNTKGLCPLLFFDHHDSLITTLWKRMPMAFTLRLQQVRKPAVLHTRYSSSSSSASGCIQLGLYRQSH